MDKLTLSAKLSARTYRPIEIAGEQFQIRSLPAREKFAWDVSQLDDEGNYSQENASLARERMICLCLCDMNGNRVFPNGADVALVSDWDDSEVSRVFLACRDHLRSRAEANAKNSSGASGSDSHSSSPAPSDVGTSTNSSPS
jgi:hypothetical protein